MPKVREVLGHVCVETASGKRKCHRNDAHAIPRGAQHLAIYEATSGGRKNYCPECARPILERAFVDLQSLVAQLNSTARPRNEAE